MAITSAAGCWRRISLAFVGLVVGLVFVANLPVTTRQGVNFEVAERRLPLYLKTFEFLDRNAQYRQLAFEITRGSDSDEKRVLAVYDWTTRRIQPAPEGWPIVDDHILNIIIRGYGQSDQRADVFATLVTYASVPAFWQRTKVPSSRDGVILTFARVDGRWVVMDIANGFLFRNLSGQLAAAEDLSAHRAILPAAARTLVIGSTAYSDILSQLRTPSIPRPLRAELQMPWPRLWDQTKRAVGYEHDDGPER